MAAVASLARFPTVDATGPVRLLMLLLLTWLFTAATIAAPLAPTVQTEIDGLLGRLEASACEIDRNGTWYGAAEANRICCANSSTSTTGAWCRPPSSSLTAPAGSVILFGALLALEAGLGRQAIDMDQRLPADAAVKVGIEEKQHHRV
ncbi:MAG: hypothetical protein ACM338_10620 [Betaproteobacteria bacterium]